MLFIFQNYYHLPVKLDSLDPYDIASPKSDKNQYWFQSKDKPAFSKNQNTL